MIQMIRQKGCKGFSGMAMLLVSAACLTINVYFPAAAVQEAANQFVEDVQTNNPQSGSQPATPQENISPAPSGTHSFLFPLISEAHAQGDEATSINTPVARQLKESMKTYQSGIASLKDKGVIGENNKGLLVDRDLKSLSLKERADANRLLATANGERMKLYLEVIRANNYPEDKLDEVQKIFAKSWRSQSKASWWIQNEDGAWVKK